MRRRTSPLLIPGSDLRGPAGATLTEVLMSLLIMGVGLTSTISLFPISILSSIRATQMTNARLLEQNVAELIRTHPQIVEGFPQWRPSTLYLRVGAADPIPNPGELPPWRVVPAPAPGRLLSSTNVFFRVDDPVGSWLSGPVEPRWNLPVIPPVIPDGLPASFMWTSSSFPAYPPDAALSSSQQRRLYVIDPLGAWQNTGFGVDWNLGDDSLRTRFGANLAGTDTATGALLRHHAELTDPQAKSLFTLPDGWSTTLETVPVNVTPVGANFQIEFAPDLDLASFGSGDRITVISTDGVRAATRNITGIGTNSLTVQALPDHLDEVTEISTVRIEQQTSRYSYFFVVIRKPDGTARVYCPVIFNRSFSPLDERVFEANLVDDQITLTTDLSTVSPLPLIKANGYVMDARNGHWYKIIDAPSPPPLGSTTPTITVDRTLEVEGPGGVIFMPGVVNVFHFEL